MFEGRGWGVAGAHTKGNNHDSLGIAFMGNFNSKHMFTFSVGGKVLQVLQVKVMYYFTFSV